MFSSRIPDDLRRNRLTLLIEEKQRRAIPIHDLTLSNPTRAGLHFPNQRLVRNLVETDGSYQPTPAGWIGARKAIAEYYQLRGSAVSHDDIVLTTSTSEGYSVLFKLLANPGDTILSPYPSYPLFEYLAPLDGLSLTRYLLHYSNGWWYDGEILATLLKPPVRLIVTVDPNNPTGSYISKTVWDQIQDSCARHRIPVLCDEVFFDYPLGDFRPDVDPADPRNTRALTFLLNGLSKVAALPQLKLSWILILGPEPLKREALRRLDFILDAYLSVGTAVQRALPDLLSHAAPIRNRIRERLNKNLVLLRSQIAGTGLQCLEVEGGWYVVLRLAETRSDEEWALLFLEKGDVLVHPGSFFGFSDRSCIVISLLPETAVFARGLRRVMELESAAASA